VLSRAVPVLAASALTVLAAGCDCGGESGLVVDLRSNLVPGVEFDAARTQVWADGTREPRAERTRTLRFGDPVETSVRIAEIDTLAPGVYTLITSLLRSGSEVARRTVRVQVQHTQAVTMLITRDCRSLVCADGSTCVAGQCVPQDCLDGSGFDGCPEPACEADDECATEVECGEALCLERHCQVFPTHETCERGEWCNPETGCAPLPERDAGAMDAGLVRPVDGGPIDGGPPCRPGECDDGNPCTDDTCEASGCVFSPNRASCDDGVFCNGTDRCAGGSCDEHAGDPCAGMSTCDEVEATCEGCASDADCPDEIAGPWSPCRFGSTCARAGTRSRTVRSFECSGSMCVSTERTETGGCTRPSRDGVSCGTRSCGSWSGCDWSGTCDERATNRRDCTDYECMGGSCQARTTTETMTCSRSTTGTTCGAGTTCGSWSGCDWSEQCDESATNSRECTDRACSGGTCQATTRTETTPCSRSTEGDSCGSPVCDLWPGCPWADACDEATVETRFCRNRVCSGGSCGYGRDYPQSRDCHRDTDGWPCGSNPSYCGTRTDCHLCSDGVCELNTPHYDASCNPSCGEAARLCGAAAHVCCLASPGCTPGGSPPYADGCNQCCAASFCP